MLTLADKGGRGRRGLDNAKITDQNGYKSTKLLFLLKYSWHNYNFYCKLYFSQSISHIFSYCWHNFIQRSRKIPFLPFVLSKKSNMQNVTTIATIGSVKFSGFGVTFELNVRCFIMNAICYPCYEVFLG